jgi:ATP-dependent Clp protease ATP-binding subunit ClpX
MAEATEAKAEPVCSWCHKPQSQVDVLIATPTDVTPRVYICDECVAVCNSLLEDRANGIMPMKVF